LVELAQVCAWELLLGQISSERFVLLEVLWADQTITVDTLALVSPQLDQVIWLFDGLLARLEHTLEDIGQVTHVEFVMEIDRGLLEGSFDLQVQAESSLDHAWHQLLHRALILGEVLIEEGTEDSEEGLLFWELDGAEEEVAL